MSSRTFDGNLESAGPGFCPAPPPPPPPPVPGQVPALKINTVEASSRRPLPNNSTNNNNYNNNNNNPYEPPAAIQNAMMTKDKKPFTYTPGMGGKLDLSQIRSPRMARRVAKNANDEGIEGPPKSSLAAEPRQLSAAPNLYIQPQVAVPVFPTNMPPQPSANRAVAAPAARVPSNASDRAAENQRPVTRLETKMTPTTQVVSAQPTPPETPTTPPQVTLAKAPTPWLQNKNKPQEELPEWAKRSSVVRPSSSTSPESPQIQSHQSQPQVLQTIQPQQSPASPMRQQQQQQSPPPPKQQSLPHERVIPLRIEDRPSVFSVKNEPGHHQFKQQQQQPSSHHQQRWGNHTPPQTPLQAQMPQFQNQNHQQYQQTSRPQSSGGGTYIVPIMVEGSGNNGVSPYNQQQPLQARSQSLQNQSPRVIVQRGPPSPQIQQQGEPGPVQSRSFRVLQKITDTDAPDETDGEQLRKLQLTEDDKILMNKFKEQVDGDGTYLHQEEDPRYRGAAIPSRAFRLLQNMTDSGDVTTTANAPRTPSAITKRQNRNSRTFEESQANLPASEQQAPEPKKYTGSAIPSRSFRILQAMTSPESIAKQENRQPVITCRTDTSMHPGNQQQGVFLSSSFPHDSAPRSLAEQSQYHTSESPSPQSQTSQSHYSQSSEIPLSQLQQYDTQSNEFKSEGLQSLEPQIKWLQLQPSQIEFAQFSQSHLSQMQPSQLQSSHFHPSQLQPPRLQPSHLQSSQSQPSHLQTPQLSQAPQLQIPRLQTPQLQIPRLQTPQLQTPQLQTPRLQTPRLQIPRLQTPRLQTPLLQTPLLQTPRSQTPQLQTLQLQTPLLQTPQLQTSQLQTPQLQTPQLQTPQLQTPQLQTPQLQTPQLQTPQLQTPQLQTPQLQTPQLQTPQLQSLRLQTPRLQPPLLQTLQSQTPQSQTTQSPTTQSQTTQSPTTQSQTTQSLITQSQTTQSQTTQSQTTQSQTTQSQTTQSQTTQSQTTQSQTTQSQTTQSQTTQSQTTQSQTTQSQTTQSQATQSQTTQSQTPQLPPIPPPFWQHPDGSCWWGYYPVHYPPSLNATTPPSSSLSSPSTRAKYNPPIPQHISPAPYENYAYYTGCHHHHHHQDGNAFAYYHPFYDERLYAAVTTAAIRTTNANGIPSSDAGASQLCTDLSSSSSSSCCSSSSCSSSSLNEGTLADVSNVLVTEDRASSCQPLASTPSTIHHRASASRPVPVFIHEPAKKLPGYDSNCNPCLERAEGSCTAETSIFRCPPVLVRNPASTQQGFPVFRGVNAWTRDRDDSISKDPALTEPGPPPWIQNIQDSLSVDDNGTEIVGTVEQSGSSIDQCNEVGWNLDGTIGAQDKSITRQFDKHLNGMKLKGTEMNAARGHQSDNHSEMEKQRCNPNSDEANRVDKKIEDEKPKWNRKNVEPNRIEKKFDDEKPQWIGSDVESFKVENPRWNRSSVAPSRDDRDSDVAEQRWNRIDNASRNLNEIAPSIPMNILHDERNVNESPVVDEVKNNDGQSFDRSEDTNASDSEIDTSSNDSSVDPERVCDDRATNTEDESDSESDSDDSDSYLAYSTGLNPHDKLVRRSNDGDAVKICADRESKKSETSITSSEDDFEERSLVVSADRSNATDCESCVEEDDEIMEVAKIEVDKDTNLDNLKADDIAPHRLSVIPEDGEQNDRRSATPNATGSDGCRNVAADRNADLTTVSISLPLRFRFSVRENEGDVTTVIVGNSTVRTETLVKGEDTDEVCVNLKLADDADTRADFTLRRNVSGEVETREPNECEENDEIDFWGTENKTSNGTISDGKEEKSRNEGADESNGDLISRSDSKTLVAQDDCIDFWETITSGRVSPDLSYNSKRDGDRIYRFSWRETDSKEDEEKEEVEEDEKKNSIDEENVKGELSPTLKIDDSRRCEEEEEEEADKDEEEESEAEEEPEEETLETSRENEDEASQKNDSTPQFELTEAKTDETEESNGRSNLENSKHLLSVQNSRDETDDEDSGVTSDMSRLISEVDTDSECGPTRKMNSYKRTQTHSRLFRLLSREDDPQGSEETPKNDSAGRDRLSLPLKSSGFSYDESHHCSNYSSGLTSPDYSPVYEGAWRRLHGDDNGTSEKPNSPGGVDNNYDEPSKNRRDPYFENWKKAVTENKIQEEKITSYNALKIVNCGKGGVLPNWRFRTNVLCPRIKSTKNVPRTIRNNRSAKPVISSSSTSNSVGPDQTDY